MASTSDLIAHTKSKIRTPSGGPSLTSLFACRLAMSCLGAMIERRVIFIRFGRRLATKGIWMTGLYQNSLISRILLLGLGFVMTTSVAAIAKDESVKIPENAKAKSYGSGWECIRGFRQSKGDCIRIRIPANAYPTKSAYGAVWECRRGFKTKGETCIAIKVPANGYLASYGDQWKCHRGYHRVDDTCLAVVVPTNAYLTNDSYGRGWTCNRGFAVTKKGCTAVKVPANAHLGFSGTSWECDRPYREKQGSCVEP